MSLPAHSTWPETAYALSLTKVGNWRAQRTAMELFCAHAFAQGVIDGPFVCSHRDLASHLYRSAESGVGSAGTLFRALVARGVLRELGKGSGQAPSEWDVAHWTRWDVPWRIREASAQDRMIAFAAAEVRALDRISARVMIRALTKSARVISADISSLARESLESRASSSIAFSTPQVRGSQLARYGSPLSIYLSDDKTSVIVRGGERGSEQNLFNQREQDLAFAFMKGAGIKKVTGSVIRQLQAIAAMANGSFEKVCEAAADPFGPRQFLERLSGLHEMVKVPVTQLRDTQFAVKLEDPREDLGVELFRLERRGLGDSKEAAELRHRLATMDACAPRPECEVTA